MKALPAEEIDSRRRSPLLPIFLIVVVDVLGLTIILPLLPFYAGLRIGETVALDLDDVTLVGNDTGGALVQLLMGDGNVRVARAVLVSCDAFDNFPPGLTGRTLLLSGKLPPPLFGVFMQQMRLRAVPAARARCRRRYSCDCDDCVRVD